MSTHIKKINDSESEVHVVFNGDMNPMIAMMAKKPLQNFVDVVVDRLEEKYS